MADVTDSAFRQMFSRYGKPAILFTEFWSTDAMCNPVGLSNIMPDLQFEQVNDRLYCKCSAPTLTTSRVPQNLRKNLVMMA